eukprot:TRINITY_DN90445_c0_g1_i1.p1 TRINITY_DN90445_c0_g1~~TRINITY_DN90445_c0_g1_i1.p1  ORF type:complete len:396 (+),score=81.68 TRINITY_DN90445_c0_g1_i1:126-1313(+)
MESADTDGASEASYESVASEGGYEPASERGRDPLPRIVSASHCVQVFQRLSYAADGVFCVHDSPEDERQGRGKEKGLSSRHNPLEGLPPRIMRFEGAMEAWLEEMPLARVLTHVPRQYTSLNDAVSRKPQTALGRESDLSILRLGNRHATLWYFTLEFLQQLWPCFITPDMSGVQIWQRALLERGCNIQSTHVEVGQVHFPASKGKARMEWLKALFAAMQASKWTPEGEARSFLAKRRLSHASMSIGDAVQIGGELFVADVNGFVAVKQGELLLPPGFIPLEDGGEEDLDEEDDEEESAPPSDVGGKKKRQRKKKGGGGSGIDASGDNSAAGKGSKGEGKGKGKGKADGKGGGKNGKNSDGARRPGEPGPGGDRADRRKLRAQLMAERDRVQGSN